MRIKLLREVLESDKDGNTTLKVTRKRNKDPNAGRPYMFIPWVVGVEMDVSDASGAKLVERGDAEEIACEEPRNVVAVQN